MPPSSFDAKLHPPPLRRNLTLRPRLYRPLDDGLVEEIERAAQNTTMLRIKM
jgi:hypothetical protein